MREEIEVGDWVSWPGPLGQDQGKVMSVRQDAYVVQTRAGSTPSYTTVARDKGVSKITPPERSPRPDKNEVTGAAI